MAFTVTLDRYAEELIAEHLRTGRYSSPEDVVTRALEILAAEPLSQDKKKSPAEAVEDIRELRKDVTLGGLNIQDLINEGRKY